MPYASNGHVSTDAIEGGVEISDNQYLEAIRGMCVGMEVTIDGGFKVALPKIEEPENPSGPMTEALTEAVWRDSEMVVVADQLLRLEDGDPKALSGTERQWRDYRIALRSWVEGAENFPKIAHRPQRPA